MGQVIVRLMGGLGNQMFQYAAGHALAKRLGAPLLLDRTFLDSRPTHMYWTPRNFELDAFPLPITFAPAGQVRRMRRAIDHRPWRLAHRFLPRLFPHRCLLEGSMVPDPRFFTLRAPVYLEGFWQNEAYFAAVASELRERLFVPKQPPKGEDLRVLAAIESTEAASIHVRRGDYVDNTDAARYHGTCSLEYYAKAIAWLTERTGVEHFFVFSDDPAWAAAHIRPPRPVTHVVHNRGRDGHWDLFLMKHCRHHIIANSSFSWWGAWLNPRPGKIVIAPVRWFAGKDTPASQILPPEWIAL